MQAALTELSLGAQLKAFPVSPYVSVMDPFHLLMSAKACWERDVGEEEKMGLRRVRRTDEMTESKVPAE